MNTQHFDVLIVGAGLSGIGAAVHLQRKCPGQTFVILEGRERMGGTWDLFKYPGIRSDSDMFTLGYSFKPWNDKKTIADGSTILSYIKETAAENNVTPHIRYQHKVISNEWCSKEARWTVTVQKGGQDGEQVQFKCKFLLMCSGYYSYDAGYLPDFKGMADFQGKVVHPQQWDTNLDYSGKNVVVIGSGATAVTLVPAMTDKAKHVVMLQRSPSYVASRPMCDPFAAKARKWLPQKLAYHVIRAKNISLQMLFYRISKKDPKRARGMLIGLLKRELPPGYDVRTHFNPKYNPWDQRVCAVPDNDLFKAISEGKASVVTDHIEEFTADGITLKSGQHLKADIVVTATGLNLLAFGGSTLKVDGKEVQLSEKVSYKGMMISDVPNMVTIMGYTNSSWTLKSDLVSGYMCRMLNHMKRKGLDKVVPKVNENETHAEPIIDFKSGYVLRALDKFPKQGDKAPWKLHQNYLLDSLSLRFGSVDDGVVEYSKAYSKAA